MSAPGSDRRNRRLALVCVAVFVGMTGMAFAAVPLYRAFCQATGFDGTVGRAEAAPDKVLEKTVVVRFDANVRGLPWKFEPSQVSQTVKIGAQTFATYKVTNTGKEPITGTAVFNVVPELAAAHFSKIDCFCFQEQTVQPGETVELPVIYFVDPAYATDPDTKNKSEITLSYTFFPSKPSKGAEGKQAALGEAPQAGL